MKSRGERLLNALEAQDASLLLEPITREDMYMNALVTKETDGLPVPVTIEEHYLHAGATNADVSTLRTPITREDVYLRGFSTKDVDALPEPITLEERFIRAAIAFLGAGAEQPEEPVDPPVEPEEPVDPPVEPEEPVEPPVEEPANGRESFAIVSDYVERGFVNGPNQSTIDYFIDAQHADKTYFIIYLDKPTHFGVMTTSGTYINFSNGIFTSDGTLFTCSVDSTNQNHGSNSIDWSTYGTSYDGESYRRGATYLVDNFTTDDRTFSMLNNGWVVNTSDTISGDIGYIRSKPNQLDGTSSSVSFNTNIPDDGKPYEFLVVYSISSEASYDIVTFRINGMEVSRDSGEKERAFVVPAPAGELRFSASYSKDSGSSYGLDSVYIKKLEVRVRK